MLRSLLPLFATALFAALFHASPAVAQDKEGQKAVPGRVTGEKVGEMLTAMGYDYTTYKPERGEPVYTVTLVREDWTFVFDVEISRNKESVWLGALLHKLPPEGKVEAAALERLLVETWQVGPHVFSVRKDNRQVYLQRALENQNFTPAKLRAAIDSLTTTIRATAPVWDIPELGKPPAPSALVSSPTAARGVTTRVFELCVVVAHFSR